MNLIVDRQIELKELAVDDADVIFKTIDSQREYLGEWLPFIAHTKAQSDTENFIKAVCQQAIEERERTYTIWFENEFAGLIGFKGTDRLNGKTEIGYWLSQHFQKRGIVTASVKFLCRYAFKKLGMNRVQIKCAVGNVASEKIPIKLGFIFEGIERAGERVSEQLYFDLKVYSLLRSDNV